MLYHARPKVEDQAAPSLQLGQLALQEALERRGVAATVESGTRNAFRVLRTLNPRPSTSLIVCSRKTRQFETFLRKLVACGCYDDVEMILVEHQGKGPAFPLDRFKSIWQGDFIHVPFSGTFNFSSMCNRGAARASRNILLFLNDDVHPLREDWLDRLLGQVQRPGSGRRRRPPAHPSGAIQHAGIALGMSDVAGHPVRFLLGSDLFPWLEQPAMWPPSPELASPFANTSSTSWGASTRSFRWITTTSTSSPRPRVRVSGDL